MKHTKIAVCFILATGVFLFAGCQKKEEVTGEGYVWGDKEIPNHVKEEITEDIIIDAKVRILPGFEDGKADILNVVENEMDRENALSVLSRGKGAFEEWAEEYETEAVYHYDFPDASTLSIGKYSVNYVSELSEHLTKSIRFANGQDGNNVEVFESAPKDLPFMTRAEAQKTCFRILSELKMEADAEPIRSFSLEHEMLKEQEVVFEAENEDSDEPGFVPKESWTEEDDCYYFEFLSTVGNCGIVPDVYVQSEKIYPSHLYEIIYGKNGVVRFRFGKRLEVESVVKPDKSLMNYETALRKVKSYYEKVMTDKRLTIKEIYLGYVLLFGEEENRYQTKPVWVCNVENKDVSTGHSWYEKVVFDAETGEEIN